MQAVNTFGATGLLSRRTVSTNASTFYTFDERGNIAQRTGSTGAVVSTDLYDAFGARTGTAAQSDPWGFGAQDGYFTDSETGLLLLTHRYYDPQSGRFLTRDPIGYDGGVNLYGYVENSPVDFMDSDGYGRFHISGQGQQLDGDYQSHIADADEAKGWPHYDKVGTNGKIWIDMSGNIHIGKELQGVIKDKKQLRAFDDMAGKDIASNYAHVKSPSRAKCPSGNGTVGRGKGKGRGGRSPSKFVFPKSFSGPTRGGFGLGDEMETEYSFEEVIMGELPRE